MEVSKMGRGVAKAKKRGLIIPAMSEVTSRVRNRELASRSGPTAPGTLVSTATTKRTETVSPRKTVGDTLECIVMT